MQAGKAGPNNLSNLGQRVKRAILRLGSSSPAKQDNLSANTPQQLLHKLHLYQLELETQNEELRRTTSADALWAPWQTLETEHFSIR